MPNPTAPRSWRVAASRARARRAIRAAAHAAGHPGPANPWASLPSLKFLLRQEVAFDQRMLVIPIINQRVVKKIFAIAFAKFFGKVYSSPAPRGAGTRTFA